MDLRRTALLGDSPFEEDRRVVPQFGFPTTGTEHRVDALRHGELIDDP